MSTKLAPGTMVGPYRVIEPAGKGGMAEVYVAEHRDSGVRVALKVFSARNLANTEFRRRIRREITSLKQCSHPNIVRVHDHQLDGETTFVALQYYEGENLEKRVERAGKMTPGEVLSIAGDLSGALAHCHRIGLFHRDIKPSNILLEKDSGRAILLDFGIVKAVNMTTITTFGGIMGSLGYLAPEQILGQAVDGRTDIYQLGMVLYKLATGHEPAGGAAQENLVEARSLADIASCRKIPSLVRELPGFPPDLQTLIQNCIQNAPTDRYQTATALHEDARRVRQGDLVEPLGPDHGAS